MVLANNVPMSKGTIVQVIGSVVDVEFEDNSIPKVFDALKVSSEGPAKDLILEVQQQIGGGVVRCISMGSSDGLKRGDIALNTGAGIKVPVGKETLGRIMNVLGVPVDDNGPIGEQVQWEIQ